MTKTLKFISVRVENTVGKGENTAYLNKTLDLSKLKSFADKPINVTEKLKVVCRRLEVPAFSPFPTVFSKGFFF